MQIDYIQLPQVSSTNDWSKEHSATFASDRLTVVVAERQTAGRGQHGRRWISPHGDNLFTSLCFSLPHQHPTLHNISQILATVVARTVIHYGCRLQIKWPNDLLIQNKKVGGILTEILPIDSTFLVIAGLGLNLTLSETDRAKIDQAATDLQSNAAQKIDRLQLLKEIALAFSEALDIFGRDGWSPFTDDYLKYFKHQQGELLRIHDQSRYIEGYFAGLNADGSLIISDQEGLQRSIYSGTIHLC